MKKIIFSNYDDIKNPYYAGGGAYAIHSVAKRLSKKYNVKVITGKYPNCTSRKVDGVSYQRIGISRGGPKIGQIAYQAILPFYVMKLSYSIWFESFTPPISTGFLQYFTKKPVVGLVHMLSGKDMKRKYKLPFDFIERIGMRTYKYFVVMSSYVESEVVKLNPKAIILNIPNGVDIPRKRNYEKKKQIVFLGRLEVNQKGLDLLLKAYKKMPNRNKIKLIIAGSGEDKQEKILIKKIKKLQLIKNVHLLGRVDSKEKEKLLGESLCLVIPSRFETFSLTALEGLSMGLPIVTFDIEGLSWIPDAYRNKAKSFSVSSLSTEIEKAIRQNTNINAREFAKKYSWKKTQLLYEKFLEGING